MGDQQKKYPVDKANRLPSTFTIFRPILLRPRIGIVEDMLSDPETDTMFAPIAALLCGIPLKPIHLTQV